MILKSILINNWLVFKIKLIKKGETSWRILKSEPALQELFALTTAS